MILLPSRTHVICCSRSESRILSTSNVFGKGMRGERGRKKRELRWYFSGDSSLRHPFLGMDREREKGGEKRKEEDT